MPRVNPHDALCPSCGECICIDCNAKGYCICDELEMGD